MKDSDLLSGIGIFLLGVAMLFLIALIIALPVQFLWNSCLVDAIDGVNRIGFFQSLGICFLIYLLFGGSHSKKKNDE
jgi:hypothetical protein